MLLTIFAALVWIKWVSLIKTLCQIFCIFHAEFRSCEVIAVICMGCGFKCIIKWSLFFFLLLLSKLPDFDFLSKCNWFVFNFFWVIYYFLFRAFRLLFLPFLFWSFTFLFPLWLIGKTSLVIGGQDVDFGLVVLLKIMIDGRYWQMN